MRLIVFALLLVSFAARAEVLGDIHWVGAIYAIHSKLVQRIYVPSGKDSEIDEQFIGGGEALLKVPIETYRTGGPAAVQAVVGTPTFSGRSAVVHKDTRVVLDVIIADPGLYADPDGHSIIPHDKAMIGDVWDGAAFTRRYVEINPKAANRNVAIVAVRTMAIDNPTPVTTGNVLMISPTMNVGSPITQQLYLKLKAAAP